MGSNVEFEKQLRNKKKELSLFQNKSLQPQQEVDAAQNQLNTAFNEFIEKKKKLDFNVLKENLGQLLSKLALYRKIFEEEE